MGTPPHNGVKGQAESGIRDSKFAWIDVGLPMPASLEQRRENCPLGANGIDFGKKKGGQEFALPCGNQITNARVASRKLFCLYHQNPNWE